MKVVLVSTFKNYGGAAVCSNRLFQALSRQGIEVELLYLLEEKKKFGHQSVLNSALNRLAFWISFVFERIKIWIALENKHQLYQFSLGNGGVKLQNHPSVLNADVIHLHWVSFSFLSIEEITELAKLKPLTWSLHDMWPFTGGCHYSFHCKNYEVDCSDCFYISRTQFVSPKRILENKQKKWSNVDFTIVGSSRWIGGLAKKSAVFGNKNVEVIGTPIDTEIFRPIEELQESSDRTYTILFGAVNIQDERKGFKYLLGALNKLEDLPEIHVLIFGTLDIHIDDLLDVEVEQLGYIGNAEELVTAYNRADIFLLPSIQDNLPNTVLESMACGTPVVAFDAGGISDLVIHKETGFLAENKQVNGLVEGIQYFSSEEERNSAAEKCRKHIEENFSEKEIASKHISLYSNIISEFSGN